MDIVIRWAGPSTAESTDVYKIERALVDMDTFVEIDPGQAAVSPYASPISTLNGDVTYGDTSIILTDASSFSSSGFGLLDDAHIEWSGKSTNTLTGVVWHSGIGEYVSGADVYEAHESYTDAGVTVANNVVVYKITRIDVNDNESAPAMFWYFVPPAPDTSDHCVVIVLLGSDVGNEVQVGENITCQLSTDNQFSKVTGAHLDQAEGTANTQTTNSFGLAFFQCWKNIGRYGDTSSEYVFTLRPGASSFVTTVTTVPDRDWIMLDQIRDVEA